MSLKKIVYTAAFLLLIAGIGFSCHNYVKHDFRKSYDNDNELVHSDTNQVPFIKIHLANGDVGILQQWHINESKDTIIGEGKHYNFNRLHVQSGPLSFAIDDIVIIETNDLERLKSKDEARIAALAILTGVNLTINLHCLANPKACFGSCPTFYINENSYIHSANAEGFSSATSPCFEKEDIDPLQYRSPAGPFFLTMKNEAFETHMVNELFVEALPKAKNEKVYIDPDGEYYLSDKLYKPAKAMAQGQPIESKIADIDETAYFSTTDSTDLFAQEEIILEFDNLTEEDFGLVINCRQTLLTTFLFYTGISYMGDEAVDYVAKMETSSIMRSVVTYHLDKFGKIKMYYEDEDGDWQFINSFGEKGPIAKNLLLIPVPQAGVHDGKLKLKAVLTKGLWRLDYMGLAATKGKVEPVAIYPAAVEVKNGNMPALDDIRADDKDYLISFPGNEFKFTFNLPKIADSQEYELFLCSKGYYLEWIRQDWIKGKNIPRLTQMLMSNDQVWEELAVEFKTMEHGMETVFWNSKYISDSVTHTKQPL